MNMVSPIAAADTLLTRTEVAGLVAVAARTVPPLWPLESAIAVNPLAGFEDLPFAEAVRQAAVRFGAHESLSLALWRQLFGQGRIDERALRDAAVQTLGGTYRAFAPLAPRVTPLDLLMARLQDLPAAAPREDRAAPSSMIGFLAKCCAAFFDQRVATASIPNRELGLYRAVLALAPYDPEYRALTGEAGARLLLTAPRDPLEAIAEGLAEMDLPRAGELDHLAGIVACLPGWAGHIRWRSEHADPDVAAGAPASMADLLALAVLLERAGWAAAPGRGAGSEDATAGLAAHFDLSDNRLAALSPAGKACFDRIATLPEAALGAIFLKAAERTYASDLAPKLQDSARMPPEPVRPEAQLVFCIDVRSEPFRRLLEAQGRYETFGYGGFFGLPIALHSSGANGRKKLLPVLLSPQHDVAEVPVRGREADAAAVARADARNREASHLFGLAKQGAATAFATAEATGPLAGLLMAARTLAPRLTVRVASALRPSRAEVLAPDIQAHPGAHPRIAFTPEEKLGYAAALFRLTGLSPDTARLVVLVGHAGSAVNNPYAAALDCGACGGHPGGSNARILAGFLNDPHVREGLAAEGLALPAETVFLAAEHNTTTDEVAIFDRHRVPETHSGDLQALTASLAAAGALNRARRSKLLGRTADDLLTGAVHWGEVRPEWGLAGNAAFIVGPRSLTRDIDLEGRAFLHSYDWRGDPRGVVLTTILTAPMVVAQWINCQYLFSTVDNERYGSGDKVTQNPMGGIGVVQGNGGDLKVGLPRQSLFRDDGQPFHVPQRLLAVVHAPFDRVEAVIEANAILDRLFGNGWVQLIVIDPESGTALRWRERAEADGEAADPHSLCL